jgi:hypothetical protein
VRGRWPAAALVVLLAAGCRGSSSSGGAAADDPLAAAPPTGGRAPVGPPPTGYGPPTVLGRIADPAVTESSGLAASRRYAGVLWTHNDSGDGPHLYCLDMQARGCGTWKLTGAEAFDWEDMAAGPGPRPDGSYLYLGDIGDNIDQRSEIVVYRIVEPTPPAPGVTSPASTSPAEALRLRYPDGPHNSEALLVHPVTGDVYVITKDDKPPRVYKAAAPLDASRRAALTQVGTIQLGTGTRPLEQVTGGDISPDGKRVALSTYAQGYELELPAGATSFDDIWELPLAPVTLGGRIQGESIAYRADGLALLTTSELASSPLQQVERR